MTLFLGPPPCHHDVTLLIHAPVENFLHVLHLPLSTHRSLLVSSVKIRCQHMPPRSRYDIILVPNLYPQFMCVVTTFYFSSHSYKSPPLFIVPLPSCCKASSLPTHPARLAERSRNRLRGTFSKTNIHCFVIHFDLWILEVTRTIGNTCPSS
jgi:hypothetical protein